MVVAFPWRADRVGQPPSRATPTGDADRPHRSRPWRVNGPDAPTTTFDRNHDGILTMKKIKTLIVDDEPLARERLATLLALEPDIEVAAQCRDGEEAVMAVQDHAPDLMFLDVQMPQMSGFDVIDAVGPERMPLVIFVTAYDQHALKAFQVRALDYILKPFDRERFSEALQRARKQIERDETGDLGRRLLALVKDLRRDQPRTDRLVVKSAGRLFFLRMDEIDWIEAAGNYVRLHVGPTVAPAARDDERDRRAARSGEVLPHPPLPHRQHGAHPGDAAVAERRVRGGAAHRHAPHAEPRLPEKLQERLGGGCRAGYGLRACWRGLTRSRGLGTA